jgi:3,4-dihydroxy-2-butanone 4-phosphate synthase
MLALKRNKEIKMNKPKYEITINHLETKHGIAKLEKDGFCRETIMKQMYKVTDGATQREREKIIGNLYDRREK